MIRLVTVNQRRLRWSLAIIAVTVEIIAFVVWRLQHAQARSVMDDERERA